jgi:secreted trypsin-like serine protease
MRKDFLTFAKLAFLVAVSYPSLGRAIIGGIPPSASVRSSTVSLVTDFRGEPATFCSGTLISSDLVLTAAHCLNHHTLGSTGRIVVSFGDESAADFSGPLIRDVVGAIAHPGYKLRINKNAQFDDVALLKLNLSAPKGYSPVPIADALAYLKPGSSLVLAGFGLRNDDRRQGGSASDGLQQVTVRILNVGNRFIVADQSGGLGACDGDSGGPGYISVGSELALVSATRGAEQESENFGCHVRGEYTNAFTYRKFIVAGAKKLRAVQPIFSSP